jgi:hypothetical protein
MLLVQRSGHLDTLLGSGTLEVIDRKLGRVDDTKIVKPRIMELAQGTK